MDERVTLVGYTSDPKAEEHAVQWHEDGSVRRGYRGPGWDGVGDAEGPGEIVRGISGEAVRILKRPGLCAHSHVRFLSDRHVNRSRGGATGP